MWKKGLFLLLILLPVIGMANYTRQFDYALPLEVAQNKVIYDLPVPLVVYENTTVKDLSDVRVYNKQGVEQAVTLNHSEANPLQVQYTLPFFCPV